MSQHQELGTWEITELPPGRTAIGCRWVYAVKTKPDGEFEKAKARKLSLKGSHRDQGWIITI